MPVWLQILVAITCIGVLAYISENVRMFLWLLLAILVVPFTFMWEHKFFGLFIIGCLIMIEDPWHIGAEVRTPDDPPYAFGRGNISEPLMAGLKFLWVAIFYA